MDGLEDHLSLKMIDAQADLGKAGTGGGCGSRCNLGSPQDYLISYLSPIVRLPALVGAMLKLKAKANLYHVCVHSQLLII